MIVTVDVSLKQATWGAQEPVSIVLGRDGVILPGQKAEGDMKTPLGTYELTHVFYRPDKREAPETGLPLIAITPQLGWCDDVTCPEYNSLISLPFKGSHEKMYRHDGYYDLGIIVAYNTVMPVPGQGSAIFCHRIPDSGYTAGCVGFDMTDLVQLISVLNPGDQMTIQA
ncbi:L,D-transpeptidase family protein [Alphaproteobacteria bacterium]|nr:L,D-transpeptidase family protein [Alphaproteobacteria bacterium]